MNGPSVCIPNLDRQGERARLIGGLAALAGCLLVSLWLISSGASLGIRLAVFPLALAGGLGVFQAREKT